MKLLYVPHTEKEYQGTVGLLDSLIDEVGDTYLTKKERIKNMKLKAIIHRAEEGGFWAEVPALRGCVSEGDTLEETIANIREATEGWLEVADTLIPNDAR